MYRYIKGNIEEIGENFVVVDNNGIGYLIYSSTNTIDKINVGQEKKIYTHLNVREDDMSLFGFATVVELDLYKLLLSVSKVGPKVGLAILSELTPSEIKKAILMEDTKPLSKASGVGAKTAKRIILELKDKIDDKILVQECDDERSQGSNNGLQEAITALQALGYTKVEVNSVIRKIDIDTDSTEKIIKLALKELAKG